MPRRPPPPPFPYPQPSSQSEPSLEAEPSACIKRDEEVEALEAQAKEHAYDVSAGGHRRCRTLVLLGVVQSGEAPVILTWVW